VCVQIQRRYQQHQRIAADIVGHGVIVNRFVMNMWMLACVCLKARRRRIHAVKCGKSDLMAGDRRDEWMTSKMATPLS